MRTTIKRRARLVVLTGALCTTTLVACGSDSADPEPTVPDDIPVFDSDVPEGVETETDEGRNMGFEDDEPSGNVTEITD